MQNQGVIAMLEINDGPATKIIRFFYDNGILHAVWDAIPAEYSAVVEVSDASGQPLNPPPDITINDATCEALISGPAVVSADPIKVVVYIKTLWAGPTEITPVVLVAPEIPRLSFAGTGIFADWAVVPCATGYQLEFAHVDATPFSPQPVFTWQAIPDKPDQQRVLIDFADILVDTVYKLRVRATAGTLPGPWSETTEFVVFQDIFAKRLAFSENDDQLCLLPGSPDTQLPQPFGIPGIELNQLGLDMQYTPDQGAPRFIIFGQVTLGRPPASGTPDARLKFTARLALTASPVRMTIKLDHALDVGGFIAQCVSGDGSAWPDGFVDLVFDEDSCIYYYDQDNDPDKVWEKEEVAGKEYTYEPGFNVDSHIQLTLIETLALQFKLQLVNEEKEKGVRASIVLDNPIDLSFFDLAGEELAASGSSYDKGPTIAIDTVEKKSFGIKTGVNFLHQALALAEINVSRPDKGGTQLEGTLTSAQEIVPFGKLSLGLTYTRTKEGENIFAVSGWPDFEWAKEIIDMVETFKETVSKLSEAASGGCGSIADYVASTLMETKYSTSSSVAMTDASLVFSLNVKCKIAIQGSSDPYVDKAFPAITVLVSKDVTQSTLPDKLAGGIAGAGQKFMEDLIHDPEAISLFLGITFGKAGVKIALELVCRGLVEVVVVTATEAIADAVVAAAAAGAGAIAITAAAIAVAATIFSKPIPPTPTPVPGKVSKPVLNSAIYENGGIAASWNAASYAASYTLRLLRGAETIKAHPNLAQIADVLPLQPAEVSAGNYQVVVEAVRGDQCVPSNPITLRKLDKPTLSLRYDAGTLSADAACEGADAFAVQFYDSAGQAIGDAQQIQPGVSASLPDQYGKTYSATAQASAVHQIPGETSDHASIEIVVAKPAGLALSQNDAQITGTWAPVTGAVSYDFRLLANGEPMGDPQTGITGTSAEVVIPASTTASQFCGQVRSIAPQQTGEWSDPVTITLLPVPAGLALVYNQITKTVVATWQSVSEAASYEFKLLDDQGALVGKLQPVTKCRAAAGGQAAPLHIGAVYHGQVRAKIAGSLGAWSPAIDITIPKPCPVGIAFWWQPGDTKEYVSTWYKSGDPFLSSVPDYTWNQRPLMLIPVDAADPAAGYLLGDLDWLVSTKTIVHEYKGAPNLLLTHDRSEAAKVIPIFDEDSGTVSFNQHASQGTGTLTLDTRGYVVCFEPYQATNEIPIIQHFSYTLTND
jgi:hypothetical protein